MLKRQRHAKARITVSVVRCAIERIDDPFPRIVTANDNGLARLLREYRVLWIIRFDAFDDESFAGKVSLSDEIDITFFINGDASIKFFEQQLPRLAGRFDCKI